MSELTATHVIWFMAASCLPRGGNRPATDASVATGRNGSANTDQPYLHAASMVKVGVYIFARAISTAAISRM